VFGEPLFIWLGCGVLQEPRMRASAARERETTGPREFAIGRSTTAQLQLNRKSRAMSIGATHEQALTPAAPTGAAIHPLWVRLTHWVNAVAMIIMIGSGWQIYNASPLFAFLFPPGITLGGWLAGALLWHFAAMWLLVVNGLVYLVLGIATGRFRRKLVPIRPSEVLADTKAAFTGKLTYDDLSVYNAVQKLLYLGVILAGIVIVLSGLAIWKPVQLQELTAVFGGYDAARYVHFFAMAAIVGFFVLHVIMALLVPKSLRAMITGR
jgi:thiosulfate reductase cytochrome b subunit